MELSYTTADGRLTVKLEGKTQSEIFEQLAQFQEVFENTECVIKTDKGEKSSNKVRFVVREDKEENKYYEIHCVDSDPQLRGKKLAFGQHKKGGSLFPRRKDGENWLPNNGWVKFNKETGKEE